MATARPKRPSGRRRRPRRARRKQPQLTVLAQYIKDLSFESPSAPQSLQGPGQNPQLKVGVNVNAGPRGEDAYEVALQLEVHAKSDQGVIYNVELVYGGLFRLQRRSAEHAAAGAVRRLPDAAVPVHAPRAGRRDPRRRLPAADARPDRFRQALRPEPRAVARRPTGARTNSGARAPRRRASRRRRDALRSRPPTAAAAKRPRPRLDRFGIGAKQGRLRRRSWQNRAAPDARPRAPHRRAASSRQSSSAPCFSRSDRSMP